MRIIFFDVDGTLSSPCYNVDGKLQIGMSDENGHGTAIITGRMHTDGVNRCRR